MQRRGVIVQKIDAIAAGRSNTLWDNLQVATWAKNHHRDKPVESSIMQRVTLAPTVVFLLLLSPQAFRIAAQEPSSRKAPVAKRGATGDLHLTVIGSKLDVYVRETMGKPETGSRKIEGSSQLAFVNVRPGQKVVLYLRGSSNDVFFPESMRNLVTSTVEGSANVIEYLRPDTPAKGTKPADFVKSLRLHIDGVNCTVELDITKGDPKTGIHKILGSGLRTRIKVRSNQKIVIDMGGANNRAIVPKAMRDLVSERVSGLRNAVDYR